MPAFTIGQNQALSDHLAWCKQIIEENERSIELFSSGKMHIGEGPKDLTSEWIGRLKEHNKTLRRIVSALEPTEFQAEVKQ